MSNRKQWTMRDGTKIRIRDMSNEHLLNTIRLLHRYHYALVDRLLCNPGPTGEQAGYAWENMQEQACDDLPEDTTPLFGDLVEEAQRRTLLPMDWYGYREQDVPYDRHDIEGSG